MAHQFYFNPYILDNLPAPLRGFDVVQDMSDPRLRMYVTSRGVKTFFVRRRVGGRDRRIIIGNYPDMDIEAARDAVNDVLARAMRPRPTRRRQISMRRFLDVYMSARVRRGVASREKLMRAINRHLAGLFDKNVGDINAADITAQLSQIYGPAISARMHEFLQSVFNYAIEQGYRRDNPCIDVPKARQNRRVRPLNRSGFVRLVAAIRREESPNIRAAFLMLIYGFAPKSRVFAMQWRDLDFNHYTWAERPLSDAAVVILQDLPQNGRWVFPGRGRGHLTDPRVAWRRAVHAAGIDDLTMDDVHKFLMRQIAWAPDREDFRDNMNVLLDELMIANA